MRLGVVGAGTMGAGIAQLGCAAGFETVLHDPFAAALENGAADARQGLERWAEKGRAAAGAAGLLETAAELDGLAGCDLVIEAVPERAELKRELFEALGAVAPGAVLATNTSSIPVTALAGAARDPERVVGMHFFNPPPLMRLVEVIAADQTGPEAVALAHEVAAAMGKVAIDAADGPGFLVNRCGRPFYAEALRCLQERIAGHAEIDRVYRLGGGFRMGPFELMDLVGVDTGYAVARSFTELSFGEPRWKPSPIQARMVAAGRLGRKAGRGYYDYDGDPHRPADPEPPAPDPAALGALGDAPAPAGADAELVRRGTAFAALAADAGLADCATEPLGGRAATGFALLPGAGLVELCGERDPAAEALAARAGLHTAWVGDAPGLVLGRVVAQLVNEAAFAIGEGVGSAADVDRGVELGLNHPRGPVAWSELLGVERVAATLDGLWRHYREERYRPAPLLTRALATGRGLAELG